MAAPTSGPPALHLVSWNVAGWDATLRYIRTYYKTLEAYLERHGCHLLALQEVKLTRQKVQADPEAVQAHPNVWPDHDQGRSGCQATQTSTHSQQGSQRSYGDGSYSHARDGLGCRMRIRPGALHYPGSK